MRYSEFLLDTLLLQTLFISLLFSTAFAAAPTPEEYLMMYAPNPVMIEIAHCESGFKQFTSNGKVLRDSVYGTHIGFYQISEGWVKDAVKRGDDIYTEQGNISFALYLYSKYGTQPWLASRDCWHTPEGGGDS